MGGSGVSLIEKWFSSGLNLFAFELVFLLFDVTVLLTVWFVLEYEGGIVVILSRRLLTSILVDVVWRLFSLLSFVCLLALSFYSV